MPILASPLQLEGYYVQEFSFAMRQGPEGARPLFFQLGLHPQLEALYDPSDLTVNTQISGGINQEEPNRIVTIVRIESRTPPEVKFPYDFLVVMVGHFRLSDDVAAEDYPRAIDALRTTAASVLYSAARELIAGMTARGPFPAAILPTAVIALDPVAEEDLPRAAKKGSRKGTAKKAAKKGKAKKQQR
jgi:preprotein translocase subunit SecB